MWRRTFAACRLAARRIAESVSLSPGPVLGAHERPQPLNGCCNGLDTGQTWARLHCLLMGTVSVLRRRHGRLRVDDPMRVSPRCTSAERQISATNAQTSVVSGILT